MHWNSDKSDENSRVCSPAGSIKELECRSVPDIVDDNSDLPTGSCGEITMAKKPTNLSPESWATAVGATGEEVKAAWEDLQRRGLAVLKGRKKSVAPLAMRRATSPV